MPGLTCVPPRLAPISAILATALLASAATLPAPATRPTAATTRPAATAKPITEAERLVLASYDKLVQAYMTNDFATIETELKAISTNLFRLSSEQRANVEYIRKAVPEQRPKWWPSTKSASNITFQSAIWGRPIVTNFMPGDDLGMQMPVDEKDGKLVIVVAWRPTNVDNPRPAGGYMGSRLGLTKGDMGEVVVWHELGHLFISSQLSSEAAMELYTKYRLLYSHLQEFFADMTALHHATPHARRVTMILRLDSLAPTFGKYREQEPHTRGAHAIGAMFLAEVLQDPAKWPSVHLPPTVPDSEVELKTIIYMYEHFTAKWTFAEDKALRDWALKVVRTQGDQIFRSKGMVPLPDGNKFSIMEAQDRDFQKKRDTWVTEKLKKAIAAGQTDKPEPTTGPATTTRPRPLLRRGVRLEIPEE